ncbi:NAD(P)-dependent oxidoreductase [Kribbella sp. NPDC051770]|uniref:NAD-dependent epimerase/dehydratase family protein n=1 Tax=Kribbella sp. NPDC051770 TaxID=3155413 RepID=UPI00342B26BE
MRVFVAGGTGVVGRPLVAALLERGHDVAASTRRTGSLQALEALGARAVVMDGLDATSVRRAIAGYRPEVVVNQMTALAEPSTDYGRWLAVTNELRRDGTRILMAEELVLGTDGVEGVVLRYGFLYGPGTAIGPGGDIATAVQAGELPIVGAGAGHSPFVHVDDAVAATLPAIEKDAQGIYNVVDDDPAPQADWLPYLADLLGGPRPRQVSEEEATQRLGPQSVYYGNQLRPAGNARAKTDLGMTLAYPSWRQGFPKVFAEYSNQQVPGSQSLASAP